MLFFCRIGLAPSQAMFNMSKGLTIAERADASVNPNLSSFYYLNKKARCAQYGNLGDEKMFEAIEEFSKSTDAKLAFQKRTEKHEMVISLVTPLMSRILKTIP